MTANLRLAIDANEANVAHRVGSNTYAFELLQELYKLTAKRQLQISILLSGPRQPDLPKPRANWRYVYVTPRKFWTQWALPIHLFLHQKDYDVFFTFSHYAPRISSVPYVSCVMDLAFLEYPEQFRRNDRLQLTHWTRYSVKNARRVITISKFSQAAIVKHYRRSVKDITVAYPSFSLPSSADKTTLKAWFKERGIVGPYFLYLGTLQPRKNLSTLISAYEELLRRVAAANLKSKKGKAAARLATPQLVIAGKVGWLAEPILARIQQSPAAKQIILTDFVPDDHKKALYQNALASVLVSLYEGFGIPPLESMQAGTPAIVSHDSSLPEVVGKTGFLVDPHNPHQLADTMLEVLQAPAAKREQWRKAALRQAKKFSWRDSAVILLRQLEGIARGR